MSQLISRPIVSRVLLLTVSVALSGCGFQLRSYDFGGAVESFAVVGDVRGRLTDPLRSTLRQAGAEEREAEFAQVVIEILEQDSDRRTLSVGGQARAAEYELTMRLRYQLYIAGTAEAGEPIAPPQEVERRRIYRVDQGNIVGSSEEQALVQRELQQDVIGQVLRVVDASLRSADEAVEQDENALATDAG